MDFTLFSSKIHISYYFCAAVCLMLFVDKSGTALPTIVGICVHETVHLIFMKIYSCAPESISIKPAAVTINGGRVITCHEQIVISLSAPTANLIIALISFIYYKVFGDMNSYIWCSTNALLFIINILPSVGLDGGTALYSAISVKSIKKAKTVLRITSVLTALSFAALTVISAIYYTFNVSFFLFALYLSVVALMKI